MKCIQSGGHKVYKFIRNFSSEQVRVNGKIPLIFEFVGMDNPLSFMDEQ
jgi:hypothetical protein